MDSVIGVAKIRQREGTMGEGVCESFAKGKIEVFPHPYSHKIIGQSVNFFLKQFL